MALRRRPNFKIREKEDIDKKGIVNYSAEEIEALLTFFGLLPPGGMSGERDWHVLAGEDTILLFEKTIAEDDEFIRLSKGHTPSHQKS